jgi:hypothetical protein
MKTNHRFRARVIGRAPSWYSYGSSFALHNGTQPIDCIDDVGRNIA